jgi:hypothetical protein
LTYRLHQIATFLLPFPKTSMLPTFDAIMTIWLYTHMAIMASNRQIAILPLWHQRWPLCVFSETAIKMWQSGADHPASTESKNSPVAYFPFFLRNSFVNAKNGGHREILP